MQNAIENLFMSEQINQQLSDRKDGLCKENLI